MMILIKRQLRLEVYILSGLPRSLTLTSGEIREAMADPLIKIVEAVKEFRANSPELAADIVDRGIACRWSFSKRY